MKKYPIIMLSALLMLNTLSSCGKVDSYFVINTNSIRSEMLVNTSVILNPSFTDLGEVANPKYKVDIVLDNEDVTSTVYNSETKKFSPTVVGEYRVTFTVLDDNGEIYKTKDGSSFSKTIIIDVVIQSFAPIASDGVDVTVTEDGTLVLGDSYSSGSEDIVDSGQYKVTGVTFEGSYSITYKLEDIVFDPLYEDPALYFGWIKDWTSNNDDCIKLGTGIGNVATWIWGKNGDIADLSQNRNQGWTKGGWWDAPGNVPGGVLGNHEITFERYVNNEKNKAIYGIVYDGQAYTYLDVGDAYSNVLNNVWVESVNTSGKISVTEFKNISDTVAPDIDLTIENKEFLVEDPINLKAFTNISDDSIYSDVLAPTFNVFDDKGTEQAVENGIFTPYKTGTYTLRATVHDLAYNETVKEATFKVLSADESKTIIDLSQMSSVAMPNSGVVIYASGTKLGNPVKITNFTCTTSSGTDVTSSTIHHFKSLTDPNVEFDYFIAPAGNYVLTATSDDGVTNSKAISVSSNNTKVYDFTYFDVGTLIYENKFAVGKGMIYYFNNNASDKQTVKLGMNLSRLYDWTIEFKITDLRFTSQGKLFITKNTLNQSGTSIGWEDLTLGGNIKGDGSQDLWGYESNVIGSGWVSYEWRSVWQSPVTTEFMPDPNDHSKGCGREGGEYSKYATGTHSYKIHCSMDENNKVTYTYYIDDEMEVVHHTASQHDGANGLDFIQFSGQYMNGVVSDIKVY